MSSTEKGHKRTRLLWLLKPFGFALLFIWVFNPYVSLSDHFSKFSYLSFLFGCLISMIVFKQKFIKCFKQVNFSKYEKEASTFDRLIVGTQAEEKKHESV